MRLELMTTRRICSAPRATTAPSMRYIRDGSSCSSRRSQPRSATSSFDHVQPATSPSKVNLLSWYCFLIGGIFALVAAAFTGGVDTGWTFYTP
ncbi:MAG: hypothetical protein U0Q16_36900 [Bryobacteraceae bacterium]